MFVEWLIEVCYLRKFIQLAHIPHYTTLQKFAAKITDTLLAKMISSFILLLSTSILFIGIDSSGFKMTNASQYYTYKTKLRKKYLKLSASSDMLFQLKTPIRHDTIDFQPLIVKTSKVLPISVTIGDKGYDSEDNHVLIREHLHVLSVIPTRFEHTPIWRTYGKYRKQMKCGYPKMVYQHTRPVHHY